ncbi:GGDEF domain-containing protein [Cryptosporangium sp. NPDC048952]|uniref:GGDEF domain-containing protein n=1 Tax=Cryptosporangium sp. NPDC048952 TaxID=3363961 RepID=UPI00371DD244
MEKFAAEREGLIYEGAEGSPGTAVMRLIRADRVVRLATIGGLYWLVAYAVFNWAARDEGTPLRTAANALFLVPIAVAVVAAAVAARRRAGQSRTGRAWIAFAASYALWLAGEAVWVGYVWVSGPEIPYPSVSDALFLAQYLVVLPGFFIAFGQGHRSRRGRALFDVSLVLVGLGALGWRLLAAPQLTNTEGISLVVTAAYPLADILVLVCLLTLGLSGHRRLPVSVRLVGWSYLIYAVTDCLYMYGRIHRTYGDGSWLDNGYQLSAVLLAIGGVVAARHREPDAVRLAVGRDLTVVPLLAAGTAASIGLALEFVERGGGYGTLLVGLVVVAGLMVRQYLVTRDRTDLARQLATALREQERLAVTDPLTGLHNRRFFDDTMRTEVARARRTGRPLSLVVLDLDHFKKINDERGHHAGDVTLVQAAARLQAVTRGGDVVARFGGEEFVWLLPDTDESGAAIMAERLRAALCARPVEVSASCLVPVTGSLGVASAIGLVDDDALLRDADRAMYHAKATGRNRVVRASSVASADTAEVELPVTAGVAGAAAVTDLCAEVADRIGLDEFQTRLVVAAGRVVALRSPALSQTDRTSLRPASDATDPEMLALIEALDAPGVHPASSRIISSCLHWAETRVREVPRASRAEDRTIGFDDTVVDELVAGVQADIVTAIETMPETVRVH